MFVRAKPWFCLSTYPNDNIEQFKAVKFDLLTAYIVMAKVNPIWEKAVIFLAVLFLPVIISAFKFYMKLIGNKT